ncbi:hypothetical protein NFI96_019588 [Prochilodus magdalenae]|nr:hypothetical protein NFI96_019588 [Prochilodus magdalenae]
MDRWRRRQRWQQREAQVGGPVEEAATWRTHRTRGQEGRSECSPQGGYTTGGTLPSGGLSLALTACLPACLARPTVFALSCSDSEWQRVIFSDESRFSLGGDDQRIRVWRHRGQHQDGVTPPPPLPHHLQELCEDIQAAWDGLSQDTIRNLYSSIPRRLACWVSKHASHSPLPSSSLPSPPPHFSPSSSSSSSTPVLYLPGFPDYGFYSAPSDQRGAPCSFADYGSLGPQAAQMLQSEHATSACNSPLQHLHSPDQFKSPGANPPRPGGFPGANSPGPVADLYGPTSQDSAVGNYISAASPQPGSGFSHSIAVSIATALRQLHPTHLPLASRCLLTVEGWTGTPVDALRSGARVELDVLLSLYEDESIHNCVYLLGTVSLEYPHTVPADGAVGVELERLQVF